MVTWKPVKLTAMHHQHLSLRGVMADYDGWQRPSQYTSVERELETVRKAGGLCDISPLGKLYIQGSDIDALLQSVFPEASSLEINGATVSVLSGQDGHMARVVVCRFSGDEVFISTTSDTVSLVAQAVNEHLAGCAHMVNMTSNYAAIKVAGPLSARLLAKMTDLDISSFVFPDLTCAQCQIAEVYSIIVRWDQGGVPSYDVCFGREFGEYMWEALLGAGQEYGIAPFGVEALNRLSPA